MGVTYRLPVSCSFLEHFLIGRFVHTIWAFIILFYFYFYIFLAGLMKGNLQRFLQALLHHFVGPTSATYRRVHMRQH